MTSTCNMPRLWSHIFKYTFSEAPNNIDESVGARYSELSPQTKPRDVISTLQKRKIERKCDSPTTRGKSSQKINHTVLRFPCLSIPLAPAPSSANSTI